MLPYYSLSPVRLLGLLAAALFQLNGAQAQVSGNQVTESRNRYYQQRQSGETAGSSSSRLFLTDSTFVLGATVMQHVRADRYVAVFGVREQAASVAVADRHLALRIQRFTDRLRRLDVAAKEVYTDIITQKRVEDVRESRQTGFNREAYVKGFELTRNVIVPFRRIETLNQMMVAAAADSIYDLVKVDYIVSDPEAVYASLFKAATEVLGRKRANYVQLTAVQLQPGAQPYAEEFSSFVPADQYASYQATITTPYTLTDYDRYKGLPPLVTYYYSPPSANSFDRVINPVVTEPVVTYTLNLQVKYTVKKPGRR
jgi:uncharacterized protein YggE